MEREIADIIHRSLAALNRQDLYRSPIVSFSDAEDIRYAELKTLIGPWHKSPGELLPGAKSVISYFVPFTRQVVAQPKTAADGAPLWAEAYQEINRDFDAVNAAVSEFLLRCGHESIAIKSTHTYDPRELKSLWSHRSAGVIAGIGSIGANRLVITKKGSGGRFSSVITTAPLHAADNAAPSKCLYVKDGSCGLCFKICPISALTPRGFDKFACQDELNKNERLLKEKTDLISADTCGKCISVCPFSYIE